MQGETTRLFLFRHGEVDRAWRGRIYGNLDVPLSARGEEQSRAAAALLADLPITRVVSSGLARAEFLASLLRAERGLERLDDPRLQEIHRGAWRGRSPDEVDREHGGAWSRWHADPTAVDPPGGESIEAVAARVGEALAEHAARGGGGSVAVVAHAWVLASYACRVLCIPLARCARLVLPTGGLQVVDAPCDPASGLRPTLVGFDLARVPDAGSGWFRGPHRGR